MSLFLKINIYKKIMYDTRKSIKENDVCQHYLVKL